MMQDKTFNEDRSFFYPANATPPVPMPIPSTPSFFSVKRLSSTGNYGLILMWSTVSTDLDY